MNIDRLALTAGAITVEDRALATPRTWRAEAITVEASALSTVDAAPRGSLRLAAAVAGAPRVAGHQFEIFGHCCRPRLRDSDSRVNIRFRKSGLG